MVEVTGAQLRAAVARSNLKGEQAAALLGVHRGQLYAYYKQDVLDAAVAERVVTQFGIHLRTDEGGYFDHYADEDLLQEIHRRLKAARYPLGSEAAQALHVVPDPGKPVESKGGHRIRGTGGPPE